MAAGSTFLYCVPHPGFFSRSGSIGGHVGHAFGLVSAATKLWENVHVICADEGKQLFGSLPVHLHTLPSRSIWDRMTWDARVLRRAASVRPANPDDAVCYVRYSAAFSWALPSFRHRVRPTPVVVEVNSLGSERHRLMRGIDARALRSAHLIVAVSGGVSENVRRVVGERGPPVVVIPNGVDLDRFRPAPAESGAAEREFRIGYVGSLKPDYGIEDLIAAHRYVRHELPRVRLSIIGDGPLRAQLKNMVAADEGVEVSGPVPFDAVPEVLRSMDVLIYTNSGKYAYQSPIKLYEYLAAGRPVIAAAIPQVVELAQESGALVTYPCGDAKALADRIRTVLNSRERREELAKNALDESRKHSWESRAQLLRSAISALRNGPHEDRT